MMTSPFDNINDIAFLPFFDSAFSVTTKDGKKTTLHVSLFTDYTDEPITDSAFDADRKRVSLVCLERDWPWVQKNISRGDEIVDAKTLRKYTVESVYDDSALGKIIYAREV